MLFLIVGMQVNIGHGVLADADIWPTVKETENKSDWAYAALLAVCGQDARYFRARTPRKRDPKLRLFPTQPPVIFVLKCK